MPSLPTCPECSVPVQPSWDWCLSCGFDPEGLKPDGWTAGPTMAAAGGATTATTTMTMTRTAPAVTAPPRPAATVTVVEDARPQQISDPDWVHQPAGTHRLSYLATFGVLAAIVVAVAGLAFVILMVLHQPVGVTRADALSLRPPGTGAISARIATASR